MSRLPIFSNDDGQTLTYPLAGGLTTSRLALGCMHFGGSWEPEGNIPEDARQRARLALETALELGWTFFDHADIYCAGRSEILFGELMRDMKIDRESIIIQSKCGIRLPGEGGEKLPRRYDFSKEYIRQSVDGSLKRLGTEYLDIFLLHRPDFLAEPEEVVEVMMELQTAGKIRHCGVSNFTVGLLDLFREAGLTPAANQMQVNLLHTWLLEGDLVADGRSPAPSFTTDGVVNWHRKIGVVTQAWAPMAYGYLSGRAPEKDHDHIRKAAKVVEKVARDHGVSTEAVVIGWLLRHPAMIQPIIGTRDPQRLKACHEALGLKLSRTEWYELHLAGRGKELN